MPVKTTKRNEFVEDPDLPKGYLSVSAVDLYLTCPMSYYLQYIEGHKPTTIPPSLVEGSSGHEVLEIANIEKAKTGDDLSEKQIIEAWDDTWSSKKGEAEWKGEDEKPDDVQERGRVLFTQYRKHYAPKSTPLSEATIEKRIETTIGGVPVVGYIDIIRKGDETPVVADYKFVNRTKSITDVEKGLQLGVYALAEGIRQVEFLCFVKTKTPKIERVKSGRTQESLDKVVRVFQGVSQAIKSGVFPFCSPDSWKCCQKFCGVWEHCPQGGKR